MMATKLNSLWFSSFVFWSVCILVHQPADATEQVSGRYARATMPMMLDMRGTPDLKGECSRAGFKRNDTDCTQFYRCVDFVRNGKHTIFRFMCGPGTVFDESKALCVRPALSNPPCPSDQLYKITPGIFEDVTTTKVVVPAVKVISPRPAVPVAVVATKRPILAIPAIPGRPDRPAIAGSPSTIIPEAFGESLKGFVTFDYEELEGSSSLVDITMTKDSFFGMILDGAASQITIREQGSLTTKWKFSIPSGAILAVYTKQDGGKITNLRNGLFSTKSTTITFAPGTSFMIMRVDSRGLFYIQEVLMVTETMVEITLPVRSIMGSLRFNEQYILTHIGTMTFRTQYIVSETTISETITYTSFGLLYIETAQLGQLVIRSTVYLPGLDNFLLGILPLQSTVTKEENLNLLDGDLLAIIPSGGRGDIKVILTDWNQKDYTINPGSIFAVKIAGSAVIEKLVGGYLTTEKTVLSFPAGSTIYVMKVSIDGTLIPDIEIVMESTFIVNVAEQSLAGIVRRSNNGIITTICNARFQIMSIGSTRTSAPVAYFGLLHLISRPAISVVKVTPTITTITKEPVVTVLSEKIRRPVITTITAVERTKPITVAQKINKVEVKKTIGLNTETSRKPATVTILEKTVTQELPKISAVVGTKTVGFNAETSVKPATVTILEKAVTQELPKISTLVGTKTIQVQTEISSQPIITPIPEIVATAERPAISESLFNLIQSRFGERLIGFMSVEDLEESFDMKDISLPKHSFFGMIPNGDAAQININEQGSLITKWQFTIPSGAILAVYTTQDGGEMTNLRNGLFSTNTTTITFAPGTFFMTLFVDTKGLFYAKEVLLVTEKMVEVAMPVRSIMGSLTFNNQYILTSIGGMPLGSHNIYWQANDVTFKTLGVVYSHTRQNSQLVIRSTIDFSFPSYDKFLTGMMSLRFFDVEAKEEKLDLVDNDMLAIIPDGGHGIVKVEFSDALHSNYSVLPGSIFAVKVAGSASIEHLLHGYFTTEQTLLSFPTGSVVYVMKVGIDGSLVPDVELVTKSAFIIRVASESLVGIVRKSESGIMTAFGEAPFEILPVTSSIKELPIAHFGLLHLVARSSLEKTRISGTVSLPSLEVTPVVGKLSAVSILETPKETTHIIGDALKATTASILKPITKITQFNTETVQLPAEKSQTLTFRVEGPASVENKITTNTQRIVTIQKELPITQVRVEKIQLPTKVVKITKNVETEPIITTNKVVTITKNVIGKQL